MSISDNSSLGIAQKLSNDPSKIKHFFFKIAAPLFDRLVVFVGPQITSTWG